MLSIVTIRNLLMPVCCKNFVYFGDYKTHQKAPGDAVIATSMHGFASCRKFKSPVTLTLDRVKVTSTYTVYVGLPANPTM